MFNYVNDAHKVVFRRMQLSFKLSLSIAVKSKHVSHRLMPYLYPHNVGIVVIHHLILDRLKDVGGVVIRKLKKKKKSLDIEGL